VDLQQECEVSEAMLSDAPYARIQAFDLEAQVGGEWKKVAEGSTIGSKLSLEFAPVRARLFRLNIARLPTPRRWRNFNSSELEEELKGKTPILFGISKDLDGVSLCLPPTGVSTAAILLLYYFKGQKDGAS